MCGTRAPYGVTQHQPCAARCPLRHSPNHTHTTRTRNLCVGPVGTALTIRVENAGACSYPTAWTGYKAGAWRGCVRHTNGVCVRVRGQETNRLPRKQGPPAVVVPPRATHLCSALHADAHTSTRRAAVEPQKLQSATLALLNSTANVPPPRTRPSHHTKHITRHTQLPRTTCIASSGWQTRATTPRLAS